MSASPPTSRVAPSAESLLDEPRKRRIEEVVARRTRRLVVVLERLQDPFNMAAVLRTCEGMGLQEVHIVDHPEVRFSPSDGVTQGCDKWLDLHRYRTTADCFEALQKRGFTVRVSHLAERTEDLYALRFDVPTALVFGNETEGCSEEAVRLGDGLFSLPMRGFTQSFNVSVAVAACVTQAVRWRSEHLGEEGDLTSAEAEELVARFQKLSVKQRRRIWR